MGLVAVAAGDLDELEPVPGLVVARRRARAHSSFDDRDRLLEQLGQQLGRHRLGGDQHDRLDGPHVSASARSVGAPSRRARRIIRS